MQKKREKQDRKKPQKMTINVKMMSRWKKKREKQDREKPQKKDYQCQVKQKDKNKKDCTIGKMLRWAKKRKNRKKEIKFRTETKNKQNENKQKQKQKQTKKDCGNEKMLRKATSSTSLSEEVLISKMKPSAMADQGEMGRAFLLLS